MSASGHVRSAANRRAGNAFVVVAGSLIAAALAFVLASVGMLALYAVLALLGIGVAGYSLREDLAPHWAAALNRISPSRHPGGRVRRSRSAVLQVGGALLLAIVVAAIAWVLATKGTKALIGVTGLAVLGSMVWLCWPLLHDLVTTPPADARVANGAPRARHTRHRPNWLTALVVAVAVLGSGGFSWTAAGLGMKGAMAVVGGFTIVGLLVLVKDRSVVFTFLGVCSMAFMLHKSFSSQDLSESGGAISIYVTSFDVMIVVMYGLWVWEGTFLRDARAAFSRPLLFVPLVGAGLMLPSLLEAPSVLHSASELFRMFWMYLLFFYLAVRVRTRRHIWAVLAGLAVFAFVEFTIVILQWRTGGVLGLSFLGVPTSLGERTTDTTEIGRPFGTILHPVFMGAVMGSLGLLALAIGIELKRSLTKIAAFAMVPVCWIPLYLAETRASLVAVLFAALAVVAAGLSRGRLSPATLGRAAVIALVAFVVALPELMKKFHANFGTGHFFEEIRSREELNNLAGHIIHEHWGLGIGLNNFELVMTGYEAHPVIFANNPVHNLYLLYLSETGIVGFCGLVLVGITFYNLALRLGRSRDRLFGGIGVGVSGVMGFLMIEELLGFSLRQDIPLAMYWVLAGLAVACYRMSEMPGRCRPARPVPARNGPTRPRTTPRVPVGAGADLLNRVKSSKDTAQGFFRRGRGHLANMQVSRRPNTAFVSARFTTSRLRRTVVGAVVAATAAMVTPIVWQSEAAGVEQSPSIVFSAVARATGQSGIYTASADGSSIDAITPADGKFYEWPRWALGNTKIVFTVRTGPPGSPEDIDLMNPDGSDVQVVAHFDFRLGQPSIDPTGRWLVYTAVTPWFPLVGIFKMDLQTQQSVNLTAVTRPGGGFDSDPTFSPSGKSLILADSDGTHTAIDTMNLDGTGRKSLTTDRYFNTDPSYSPDASTVAIASYRGTGKPSSDGGAEFTGVRTSDWHLVLRPRVGGTETVLTKGIDCTSRSAGNPCAISDTSAFQPQFSADGSRVYFVGSLDDAHTCICSIGVDGSAPTEVLNSIDLAINWYDLRKPVLGVGIHPLTTTRPATSRVLMVISRGKAPAQLVSASPDLMQRTVIPLPKGLVPLQARWAPDGRTIVFVASVKVRAAPTAPHPAAPPGHVRRDHVTLNDTSGALAATAASNALTRNLAAQQVFIRSPSGAVRQVTDPWIEDWRDGVAPGDARSNTDPTFSPDGRYLVVKNTSTLTGESFLLRIDQHTGAVLNLTNATSGAVPVDDTAPAYSPNGKYLAFCWTNGGRTGLYVMNSATGESVRLVANDSQNVDSPAWLPNSSGLVYSRQVGKNSVLVTTLLLPHGASRTQHQLLPAVRSATLALEPVVSPDGRTVIFLGPSVRGVSVYTASTKAAGPARLLQADALDSVHFVDWR